MCSNASCDGWLWTDKIHGLCDTSCSKCKSRFHPEFLHLHAQGPFKRLLEKEKLQPKPAPQEYDISSSADDDTKHEDQEEIKKFLETSLASKKHLEECGIKPPEELLQKIADAQDKIKKPSQNTEEKGKNI